MDNINTLKAIKENLEYNLALFDKIDNLGTGRGIHRGITLVESRSDVVRSIWKIDTLIEQLEEDE